MTVCIAAYVRAGDTGTLNSIVLASDQKVSLHQFSGDNLTIKMEQVITGWQCLMAGSDVTIASAITNRVLTKLVEKADSLEITDLISAFKEAYQEQLQTRATDLHLSRLKLTMEEFRTKGRRQLGSDVFDMLCDKIARVSFDLEFLVAGFDRYGEGHIFVISNPGVEDIYDRPGFWAIGSGRMSALSMLFYRGQRVITSLEQTVYHVCEAKFMAESATDVGKRTFLYIVSPPQKNKIVKWDPSIDGSIRSAWEQEGAPKIPNGIIEKIKQTIRYEDAE